MRSPVFKHTSNPAIDLPDYYVSKSSKRSMLKHGQAEELPNGSLLLKTPFNPMEPPKKGWSNGTGGGSWKTCQSGSGHIVMQLDRSEWPMVTGKAEPQSNGWPNRMVLSPGTGRA